MKRSEDLPGDHNDRSDAAIVIATLILASMFPPLKNGLQAFVDRRFKPEAAQPAALSEDYSLTLEQRVVILEGRLSRMEVGADPLLRRPMTR